MNIVMVYPKYPDTFWSFRHALKFVSKKASFPPLGLLTVAAMLPNEWNKKLIDMNVNELKDEDIL
ncbi:MAG: B12-binding domain-containing radical SAM protein, partial [Bacteroidetes bacterium]